MESSIFIEPKQETNKDANKSFLDFGLSYLDFRSNRSGSSGIPPIPWKPTEGFF